MWCKNCRQDVPGVTAQADAQPCCIRCGGVILFGPSRHEATDAAKVAAAVTSVALRAPLSAFDTWELDEQLRHVDRLLSGARFTTEVQHPAEVELPPPPSTATKQRLRALADEARPRRSRTRLRFAWGAVIVGAAALTCGVGLLCAGTVIGRAAWQSCGLPLTLLGQASLLLGMMMQLDLVWHGKRETASKLYRFQKRLSDLEALASELAPETADAATTRSDDREMMVELKSRLDVLSHRLNVPCG